MVLTVVVCFTSVFHVSFFVHPFFTRWVGVSGVYSTENHSVLELPSILADGNYFAAESMRANLLNDQ